ncbi:MAG: DUF3108 domain-containing protein [Ottowia sp.]|nr:DUF3108 domain-containing protein [Ottowia sp.]
MAGPLKPPPPRRAAPGARLGALAWATLLVLLLHLLMLTWLRWQLQPASVLRKIPPTFYTRTLAPQAAPEPAAAAAQPPAAVSPPKRGVAQVRLAQAATKSGANSRPPRPPRAKASSPRPAPRETAEDLGKLTTTVPGAPPEAGAPVDTTAVALADAGHATPSASAPAPAAPPASAAAAASAAAPASTPASAPGPAGSSPAPAQVASGARPAFLASWPADTRLTYRLGGNYRGELHGDAEVLWQRDGTRYQAVVQMDVGFLLNSRFTSQGEITAAGLRPEAYEEQVRQRRRGVRLGPQSVQLQNGERVPRPQDVQDAASQFVELGHRFATGQLKLQAGGRVDFWLARPGGVDQWTYDVVGEETVHLPRLGAIQAFHLKPRPLNEPRGNISAEMWFAPSLQYLPVRIRIAQGADTYLDLLAETVEQK